MPLILVLKKKTTLHLLYQVSNNLLLSKGLQKLFTDRPYMSPLQDVSGGVRIPVFAVSIFPSSFTAKCM